MAAFILFVMSTFTGPALAQEPQWEIVLADVHGPIAVDPANSDIIYMAIRGTTSQAYPSGILKSTDRGKTWEHYAEGSVGEPQKIFIHPDNPDTLFVLGIGGFKRSTDGGKTWKNATGGLLSGSHGLGTYDMAYHSQENVYYLAQDAVMHGGFVNKSEDGMNWEESLFWPTVSVLIDEEINTIYVAGAGSGLMRSTNGGESWQSRGRGLSGGIFHLTRVPGSRTIYAAGSRGIFKSYDRAENWFPADDSLTRQFNFIRSGLLVSKSDTNTVIVGAKSTLEFRGGVFISRDGGKNWQYNDYGIPDSLLANVLHLFLDHEETLYANISTGTGIYLYRLDKTIGTGTSSNESGNSGLPESVELHQNYPNPFNPVTVIEYDISEPMEVTLRVYDVMGRLVDTLVDQMVSPGRHQATWNASNVGSGTYIYRLRAGDFVQSRQMLLIK